LTSRRGENARRPPRPKATVPAAAPTRTPSVERRPPTGGEKRPPRVVILGRPNVGKSTLFNALIGRRRAITFADPGVTRDAVEAECVLGGARILLVDTGGYSGNAEGSIDKMVATRSLDSARTAALVLLVMDATETTTEDDDFIRRLRPYSDKILLVVNKVDTPDRDPLVWNAHEHGFPNVIGVSAAHHRSIERLKETVAGLLESLLEAPLPPADETAPESRRARRRPAASTDGTRVVRVAILGKPNTGKSSLANRLTGEDRSIVSPIAGTTRDVVEADFTFKDCTFRILDTAGIRRKSRVQDPVEYYSVNRAIESIGKSDLVFLMIDAAGGLADQDKKIAWQAVKEGRGIILVLARWDLLQGTPRLLKDVTEKVRFQFPVLGFAPVLPVSAVTGYGVTALLDTAREIWQQLHQRVGTGRLNQALEEWLTHYRLPVRGKNYKIRFMTQVSANPVRFVAFVNRMSGFPVSYTQYLENCVRRDLGFPQCPVSIELRQSKKTGR
jgi:GTP-binding protein